MTVSLETIEALRRIDTPTVCNALELIDPALRRHGFNRRPFVCPFPDLPPLVGFARTAEITCSAPTGIKDQRAMRLGYYAYVENGTAAERGGDRRPRHRRAGASAPSGARCRPTSTRRSAATA